MERSFCLTRWTRWTTARLLPIIAVTVFAARFAAEQVHVVQRQGAIHGFMLLKDDGGREIGVGDVTNEVRGNVIRARTVFRFRDGSVDDEETVYRQGTTFQLMRDHRVQKGPSFTKPSDITIDAAKGDVSWADSSNGQTQSKSQHMDLPRDLANGLVPTLIENLPRDATELKVPYLVIADSKPRIVTLTIKPDGTDKILLGGDGRKADRYNIHTDIGGIAGVVAPIVGKQPPDIKLWLAGGTVPAFVRMDGPFYERGPVWTVMLAAPSWPTEESK